MKNQLGMSLVSTLVAVSIVSVTILTISQMMNNMHQQINRLNTKEEQRSIQEQLDIIFSTPEYCQKAFTNSTINASDSHVLTANDGNSKQYQEIKFNSDYLDSKNTLKLSDFSEQTRLKATGFYFYLVSEISSSIYHAVGQYTFIGKPKGSSITLRNKTINFIFEVSSTHQLINCRSITNAEDFTHFTNNNDNSEENEDLGQDCLIKTDSFFDYRSKQQVSLPKVMKHNTIIDKCATDDTRSVVRCHKGVITRYTKRANGRECSSDEN